MIVTVAEQPEPSITFTVYVPAGSVFAVFDPSSFSCSPSLFKISISNVPLPPATNAVIDPSVNPKQVGSLKITSKIGAV